MHRLDNRAGVMTVWAALCSVALILTFMGVAAVASAVHTRHRAQNAADLTALAAATALRDGADPCALARRIAELNAADLRACTPSDGGDVVVTTETRGFGFHVSASARAGPLALFAGG